MNRTFKKINVVLSFALLQFFFFQSSTAHAQLDVEYEWVEATGQSSGSSNEQTHDIAVDGNNNVYAIGNKGGSINYWGEGGSFISSGNKGSTDIWITKFDENQNFLWNTNIGSSGIDQGNAIAVDAFGNVYIAGMFARTTGGCEFGYKGFSDGIYIKKSLPSSAGYEIGFVAKLNTNGEFQWVKTFEGNSCFPASIAVDPSGNVYTTGYFSGTVDFDPGAGTTNLTRTGTSGNDVFVSKLDNNGNFIWAKNFGASGTNSVMGRSIVTTATHVYIKGYYEGAVNFRLSGDYVDKTVSGAPTSGFGDYFIAKINSAGTSTSWAYKISRGGTTGYQLAGNTLAISSDGTKLYATGDRSGGIFVTKINNGSASADWIKTFGSTSKGQAIAVDGDDNVFFTGNFSGTVDFDPNAGVQNLTSSGSGNDAFVASLDSDGNYLFAKQFAGTSSSNNQGNGIQIGTNGEVYSGGWYSHSTDFDPGAGTENRTSESNSRDLYIHKLFIKTCTTPPAPTAADQSFCASENARISDLAVSGETGATFTWYNASTGGTAFAGTTSLVDGTTYYVSQTVGGCESTTRTAVTVTITNPAAPTVTQTTQAFCTSDAPTVADLSASGTAIQWYANSTGGTALSSGTALVNGTTYYVSQTVSGCESTTRTAVTVTLTSVPAAPTAADQSFCDSDAPTVADLIASGTNIQWYSASTGGTALAGTDALTSGSTYYASQTVGCESTNRTEVDVTIYTTPAAPTVDATHQPLCNNSTGSVDLSGLPSGNWTIQPGNISGSGATHTINNLAVGTTHNITVEIDGENCPSTSVPVIINAAPALLAETIIIDTCAASFTWIDGIIYTANTTAPYPTHTVAGVGANGCDSIYTLNLTIRSIPSAPTVTDVTQQFCVSGSISATVDDLVATGTGIEWYLNPTGGTALLNTELLADATTYYASIIGGNGCESSRVSVAVELDSIPDAPTVTTPLELCGASTVADLEATGEVGAVFKWYDNLVGGTELASTDNVVNGGAYHVSQTVNGCEGPRVGLAVLISPKPATPTADSPQAFCGSATVNDLAPQGANIEWHASDNTLLTGGDPLAHGSIVYVSVRDGNCESDRVPVVVQIHSFPSAPTASAQSLCGSATVADLLPAGTGYTWYDASTGGTALASTEVLTTSTYYISQTNSNGCEGPRTAVSVTNNNVTHIDTRTECNPFTWIDGNVYTADNNTATYTFVSGAASGCDSIVTLDLTISGSGPTVSIDNVQNVDCFGGNNGSAEAVAVGGTMPYTYAWSPTGGTNAVANNLTAGNYIVEVTDDAGCVNSALVTITSPAAIGIDTVIVVAANCGINDGSIAITPNGGTPNYQYSWENGETSSTLSNSSAGSYNVTITDDLGCSLDTTFTIPSTGELTVEASPEQTTIENGETVDLAVNIDSGISSATYTWTPTAGLSCVNCPNPVASPSNAVTYYVTVETPDGCSSTASVQIEVTESCTDLFIPNMFSPNSDGENDSFCVYGSCMSSFEISIYNRWGELIFNSEDQNECWNGTFKGKKMNTDVFVYKMKATTHKGEVIEKSGNINLIR